MADDELRRRVEAKHARETAHGHRPLPTSATPGFHRRFDLASDDTDGFRTWILTPSDRDVTRTLFYLHGGSYMAGIDAFHLRWTTRLARRIGARVILPDYPLAPEHTWRDSHAQLVAQASAWAERAAQYGEQPLLLAGDSAGGGLALSVAQGMREAGGAQAGKMVLHAPWVDLRDASAATRVAAQDDPWLDVDKHDLYARWWAGEDDPSRWEVSPLLGNLDGLPPTVMLYGTRDLLSVGCRELTQRAQGSTWRLQAVEEPGLLHVYSLFPEFVTEARRAFRQVLDFIEE